MDTTVVLSLALSAVVAALVTLLIEYAAKPRLEARKERILRERRALWDLRDALMVLDDKVGSTRQSMRQEEIEPTALDAQIDDVLRELQTAERLATVAREMLPPAIWEELAFGFGRHSAMAEMVVAIRTRLNPTVWASYYRSALRNLGGNLSLPTEYLTTGSRRRRQSLLQEAKRREEERGRGMRDEDDDGPDDFLWETLKKLKEEARASGEAPSPPPTPHAP